MLKQFHVLSLIKLAYLIPRHELPRPWLLSKVEPFIYLSLSLLAPFHFFIFSFREFCN